MSAPRLLSVFVLCALATVAQGAAPPEPPLASGWQGRLAAMLPQTGQSVYLMERQASIVAVELARGVATANGDPAALTRVLTDIQRGVSPTYDPRLNITEAQFRSYVVLQNTLAKSRALKLALSRDANRVFFGSMGGAAGVLSGVTIDLRTGEMRGPEGFTARPSNLSPTAGRELDVRSGFQWKMNGSDSTVGNGVRGTLYLLQQGSGQIILYYKRTSMVRRVTTEGEVIIGYAAR